MEKALEKDKIKSFNKTKLLLVEGKDEMNLFSKLFREWNIEDVELGNYEGKDKLGIYLKLVKITANFEKLESIGIIRDADDSVQNTFTSVCNHLKNAGFGFPISLGESCRHNNIKISIFLMPNCKSTGETENLFIESIRDEEIYKECIINFLECAKKHGKEIDNKAEAYAYIAVQKKPEKSFGVSVKDGYWLNLSHPCFDPLKDFLREI
jgi:hypothetical protein